MKLARCFTVVGLKHYAYDILKEKIIEGEMLVLKYEPENIYDKNAVSVWWKDENGGLTQIGYISKGEADGVKDIHKHLYQIMLVYKSNSIIIVELENPDYEKLNPISKFIYNLKNRLTT
jgi:hypothetical protein